VTHPDTVAPDPSTADSAAAAALETRIRASFARQGMIATLQGRMTLVAPGRCEVTAPITPGVSQQHGAGHAALAFALGDTAAGYAALTLMPEGTEVMTAEIKINLMRPATGSALVARGEVLRAGRRLIVVRADIFALRDGAEVLIAVMQGTMVPVEP